GALAVWQELRAENALTLRVWQSLPHEQIDKLVELGVRSGLGDDLLRVGYIKAFMDGTLGSRTARLLDGSGVQITSREELEDIVRRAARGGLPVAVHAIGDLANKEALEAFDATCIAPAWLAGDERRRGKLLPGYLADLVVLDRDPFECPPEELAEIDVVATMLGGRWVFNAPPWDY